MQGRTAFRVVRGVDRESALREIEMKAKVLGPVHADEVAHMLGFGGSASHCDVSPRNGPHLNHRHPNHVVGALPEEAGRRATFEGVEAHRISAKRDSRVRRACIQQKSVGTSADGSFHQDFGSFELLSVRLDDQRDVGHEEVTLAGGRTAASNARCSARTITYSVVEPAPTMDARSSKISRTATTHQFLATLEGNGIHVVVRVVGAPEAGVLNCTLADLSIDGSPNGSLFNGTDQLVEVIWAKSTPVAMSDQAALGPGLRVGCYRPPWPRSESPG